MNRFVEFFRAPDATAVVVSAAELPGVMKVLRDAEPELDVVDHRSHGASLLDLDFVRPTVVLLGAMQRGLRASVERARAQRVGWGHNMVMLVPDELLLPDAVRWIYGSEA